MTDNTQELDDAPDLSDTHVLVDVPGFGKVWAVNYIHGYYNTWLDWHNKQTLELLDRLESQVRRADDCTEDTLVVKAIRIEAERNKLNEAEL